MVFVCFVVPSGLLPKAPSWSSRASWFRWASCRDPFVVFVCFVVHEPLRSVEPPRPTYFGIAKRASAIVVFVLIDATVSVSSVFQFVRLIVCGIFTPDTTL